MAAKVKIIKKTLPHAIAVQQVGDGKVRDLLMKINENIKAMMSQIVNLQNAVIELQKT